MKTPTYPPRYIICLIDTDGFPHEFIMSSRAEAVASWQEDKSLQDDKFLHGFLYVEATGGFGVSPRHLLDSF